MTFKEQMKYMREQQKREQSWSAKQTKKAQEFESEQAQKQMDFQKMMSDTAHQREMADLKAAGLNPVLSATSGAGASSPSGAMASGEAAAASSILNALPQMFALAETSVRASASSAKRAAKAAETSSESTAEAVNNSEVIPIEHANSAQNIEEYEPGLVLTAIQGDPKTNRLYNRFSNDIIPKTNHTVKEWVETFDDLAELGIEGAQNASSFWRNYLNRGQEGLEQPTEKELDFLRLLQKDYDKIIRYDHRNDSGSARYHLVKNGIHSNSDFRRAVHNITWTLKNLSYEGTRKSKR